MLIEGEASVNVDNDLRMDSQNENETFLSFGSGRECWSEKKSWLKADVTLGGLNDLCLIDPGKIQGKVHQHENKDNQATHGLIIMGVWY